MSVEELGAREVAADNAEALAEAFERMHPEVGAAVGASMDERLLEATFSVCAFSLGRAARKAHKIFVDSAVDSGLEPSDVKSVEVEIDLEGARRSSQSAAQRPACLRIYLQPQASTSRLALHGS